MVIVHHLVFHLSKHYKKRGERTVYRISKECKQFQSVYNSTQHQLKALGGTDELLCGMYVYSSACVLRVCVPGCTCVLVLF